MSETFDKLERALEEARAVEAALALFEWDNATIAPREGVDATAILVGSLTERQARIYVDEEVRGLLEKLEREEWETLGGKERAIVREARKVSDRMWKVPPDVARELAECEARAMSVWERAREEDAWGDFEPMLEELVRMQKKVIEYRFDERKHEVPYDALLETFEPEFPVRRLDAFFGQIKEELVPFIREVAERAKGVDKSYNFLSYPVEGQRKFCRFLSEYVGLDMGRTVLAESAHPFTTGLHNRDIRITNHFYENNLESAIFSAIHESGHGIYEMQVSDEIAGTIVGGGTSMGMHESQSRFFENVIGRSEAFWKPIYGRLVGTFPEQLGSVPLEAFLLGANKPELGPIRTEADELTYPLHILVRYEIEKMLFSDEIGVRDLPRVWDEKYEEYLGVRPRCDREGVLQDVHWSSGDFGYFPSYALGSAAAAQIYHCMRKSLDVDALLEKGELGPILAFLERNVHRYGKTKTTNEILREMSGKELNPDDYIAYLKEKYARLYL